MKRTWIIFDGRQNRYLWLDFQAHIQWTNEEDAAVKLTQVEAALFLTAFPGCSAIDTGE